MEMERGINPDETLDYVEFHIFPSQNRYEANAWSSNRDENVASGPLEQLQLLDSPETKTLSTKGSNTKFKILPPENVNDTSWFTTATLKRFLHVIGLPDIVTIGKEILQLEETKNFQLSLSDTAEADIITSTESKNELLLAVDLRLTELKQEVASVFKRAIGSNSSPKDISDIKNFAFHFATKNLRDSLQNLSTISTEDEDSTVSSEDDEPSVERSRTLTRSATPRRSASPMRRIQIGRSGSRRAASLTIKSLNYFPVKEKSTSNTNAAGNSSEKEEEEDPQRPPKKLSVQDKISLFESKQRDQRAVDIHKTKTSVGANKAVLKRWSSGVGEKTDVSSPSSPKNAEPDINIINININKTETCVETVDQCMVQVDISEPGRDESCEKTNATVDWSQQKGAELTERDTDNIINKSLKEQRGGFYELYNKKREEKLKGEASRKLVEKEAKTGSVSTNRRLNAANEHKKTQKNSTQLINSRTTKASSVKKSASKPPPLHATRKSWPSTPSPARTPTGPTSTNSTPTNRKPQSASSTVRSSPKVENSQNKLKTPKSTQQNANKTVKAMDNKKQPKVTENKQITKTNVKIVKTDTTATSTVKPNFYNKVTKKSSVVPLETKPFLRKGSGTGPSVGPVIKTKAVAQKTEENKTVTKINITEVCASVDLEPRVVNLSPTKCDGDGSGVEMSEININIPNEEEFEISQTAWVVSEEAEQDEIVPCKESPAANVEPPAGFVRPRVRHSLSQMLLEDNNEVESDEWGNAEHPPTMVYQKDSPRGFKRLLKFARKAKADSHQTAGWSSPSAFSEGEDDTEESKGQSSLTRYNVQTQASINTKATRSFFSLSAFRGNKTDETKLLHH